MKNLTPLALLLLPVAFHVGVHQGTLQAQPFPAAGSGSQPIGNNYCLGGGGPESALQTGTLRAYGSTVVANNDVRLEVVGLPQNVMGYFLVGETQALIANPAGAAGDLCLGGRIGRFNHPSLIRNSGVMGSYSLDLDLGDFPLNPSRAVMAGQTWNFQSWFRRPVVLNGGGSSSDFTTAVSITFQ